MITVGDHMLSRSSPLFVLRDRSACEAKHQRRETAIAMDLWALNLKTGGLACRKERERGLMAMKLRPQLRYFAIEERNALLRGVLEFRVSARRAYRSLVVRATGKRKNPENSSSSGDDDPSIPGEDGPEQTNTDQSESKSDDSNLKSIMSDWRDFRASLVAQEQVNLADPDAATHDSTAGERVSPKWAHPLPTPEPGCVLVATDKLDGVHCFERTVVLLLRLGTRDPQEGPFGVIINRSLHKRIKHINPSNADLASTFADCSLYFGGPLDASMFLLKGESSAMPGLEQVIPGICFGARNSFDEAAALVKKGVLQSQDFRFFVGYAGWQIDQLREEIESDYWVVAACSSNLIAEASADTCLGLWEEILHLMGGRYSELSKKPKPDGS